MLFKETECPQCQADYDPALQFCPVCHVRNPRFDESKLPKRILFLNPIAQLGMFLVGFAYVGMLAISYGLSLIISTFNLQDYPHLSSTLLLAFTYLIMTLVLFAIPFFTRTKDFINKFTNKLDYIYGIGYAVTIVCVSSIVNAIINWIYPFPGDNLNQETATIIAKAYPLIAFFVIGLLGPIAEELTYRVGLFSFLRRINKYLAIIVTAVIFGFIHFDTSAEDMIREFINLPAYIVSGLVFSIAYEHRGPACSITAHVLYNIFAFIMIFAS
ncbi:MAG: CPBP family intramembrane metalloprotease [Erysipelotrichaceae bacterium]|nr:CPBP family intramembrane metalloprotease [Erysipelotrichaceae bacterium]